MTLDGHIKSGLAISFAAGILLPGAQLLNVNFDAALLIPTLILFLFGNIAPDILEMRVIPHRTYTHYPWFYIAIIAYGVADITQLNWLSPEHVIMMVGFCFGCLVHIFCDIPYGGIPYFRPTRKVTFMRVPFDSKLNRLLEYGVVLGAVATLALWDVDINGWIETINQNGWPGATEQINTPDLTDKELSL